MFKRIKNFLNPAPKYSCSPEERYYAERGISEPVIAILKSIDERSKDWEIRRAVEHSSYILSWFNIKDKKTDLNFSIAHSREIVLLNFEDTHLQMVNNHAISWVTSDEESAIIKKLKVLYLKRLSRLESIKSISEKRAKQKLRNEWKEKYQC